MAGNEDDAAGATSAACRPIACRFLRVRKASPPRTAHLHPPHGRRTLAVRRTPPHRTRRMDPAGHACSRQKIKAVTLAIYGKEMD